MVTIKTLDEQLREKAVQLAETEIRQAFNAFEYRFVESGSVAIPRSWLSIEETAEGTKVEITAANLMHLLHVHSKAAYAARKGQEAVDVFVRRVNSLQEQLDELREGVEE